MCACVSVPVVERSPCSLARSTIFPAQIHALKPMEVDEMPMWLADFMKNGTLAKIDSSERATEEKKKLIPDRHANSKGFTKAGIDLSRSEGKVSRARNDVSYVDPGDDFDELESSDEEEEVNDQPPPSASRNFNDLGDDDGEDLNPPESDFDDDGDDLDDDGAGKNRSNSRSATPAGANQRLANGTPTPKRGRPSGKASKTASAKSKGKPAAAAKRKRQGPPLPRGRPSKKVKLAAAAAMAENNGGSFVHR